MMSENDKLKTGNECLLSRDFDKARILFNEVLNDDPSSICALRGKMFCDLGISEIKELKTKSIVEGQRFPYSKYAKSAPEKYSSYFENINKYFELGYMNSLLAEEIAANEKITGNNSRMIAESSVKEGMRGLFGGHYYKRRSGAYVKSLPDIIGLIIFSIVIPLTLTVCILETGITWPEKIFVLFFILFIFGLFALPGFQDLAMIRKGKSELKVSYMDIKSETASLRKQIEKNSEIIDSTYFKIRDTDNKIMQVPD